MAQIPSWLWLIAGIIVIAGSLYVGEQISLFFYVGLLFIAIGIAKIVLNYILRKKETKTEKTQMPRTHPQYNICRCGQYVRKTDNFCWSCGTRLR